MREVQSAQFGFFLVFDAEKSFISSFFEREKRSFLKQLEKIIDKNEFTTPYWQYGILIGIV